MKCEQMKIIGDGTSFCTEIGAKTSFIPSFASLFSTCDNTFIAAVISSHDLSSQKLLHTNFFHTSFLRVFFLSFFSISAWKEISNVEKCRHGVPFAVQRCALILFYFVFWHFGLQRKEQLRAWAWNVGSLKCYLQIHKWGFGLNI